MTRKCVPFEQEVGPRRTNSESRVNRKWVLHGQEVDPRMDRKWVSCTQDVPRGPVYLSRPASRMVMSPPGQHDFAIARGRVLKSAAGKAGSSSRGVLLSLCALTATRLHQHHQLRQHHARGPVCQVSAQAPQAASLLLGGVRVTPG